MGSLVKQFIDSLEGKATELPDTELADLAEDSKAVWAQKKTAENDATNPVEFLRRRITATQELGDERYKGRKVPSKKVFSGDNMTGLAHARLDKSNETNEDDSEDLEDGSIGNNSVASSSDQESFCADNNTGSEEEEHSEQSQSKEEIDAAEDVVAISSDTQPDGVRKQLMIWDRLMQLHILSHAALRVFNQLPREQLAMKLEQSADMRKNLEQLNEIFMIMEDALLKSSKQTKGLLCGDDGKKVEDPEDEEIESSISGNEEDTSAIESDGKDSGEESDACLLQESCTNGGENSSGSQQILGKRRNLLPKELTKEYEKRHERFAAFRSSVLTKWDERTTLSNIGIIKNKKTDFSAFESVVLKQIEQIMSEKHRLIRRTQMKRHDVDRIGGDESNDYDEEIFDDDDFYQQLLKELIERKSTNVLDPIEMSRNTSQEPLPSSSIIISAINLRQWLEIQKLRQKRSKRKKVDTKASKGRKIRYVVIPKLVNFFPSMPEKATWSHEKRNQLFKSLFS